MMTASHDTISHDAMETPGGSWRSARRETHRAAADRLERALAPASVRRRRGRIAKPSG